MNDSSNPPLSHSPTPPLGRILIVDDETELMTALCESLAEQGYEATGFASGQTALEALEEQDYDVLLTDLMMPGMDGVELLKRALVIDPHLIGVLMTGQGTVQTAVEAMKVGAVEYILKPFKLNVILPVVSRAMEMRHLRLENLQLRESVAIYELSQAIAHTLDMGIILNKVADAALQQCQADEVSVMLPTRDGRELYVATIRGGEERSTLAGTRVPIEQGIAGWVARQHEPVTLHGEVNDPRFAPVKPRPDIHSSICLPMQVGGKCVGVLNINATHRRRPFSLGQVKAVSILAGTAAAALEGAWLYEQVKQSEEHARNLIESSLDMIISVDSGRNITVFNRAAQETFGYSTDEVLGKHVNLLYADPDEGVRVHQNTVLQGRCVQEVLNRRKDGEVFPSFLSSSMLRDAQGAISGVMGVSRDITEQKCAEAALTERARLVALAADVGFALTQSDAVQEALQRCAASMVRHLDAAFARIWILKPGESILELQASAGMYTHLDGAHSRVPVGQLKIGLVAQERSPHITNAVIGDPRVGDQEWAKREGIVSFAGHPLIVGDRVVGVMAMFARHPLTQATADALASIADSIAVDIERTWGEESLTLQLNRISLLNQIARAIDEKLDLQSIYHVVLQHVEDGLPVDMAGVLTHDSVSGTFTIAARGPKSQVIAQELGLGEGAQFPFEHTCFNSILKGDTLYMPDLSKIGTPVQESLAAGGFLSGVAVPLTVEGQLIGVLVVARREVDAFISAECEFLGVLAEHVALAAHQAQLHEHLQKAYDELRNTQRAVVEQERLSALGQMASGIAHDINNALSPISGYAQLLQISETDLSAAGRKQLATIETSAADIAHIVARMREFYRKRDEQQALQPVNPNDLIHQVIDLTRAKWRDIPQQSGIVIEVQTQLSEDLPLLRGIESEIREALTNLIFNAVDAMPEGGVITLRSRVEGVGEWEKGRVREEGRGSAGAPAPTRPLPHSPTHVLLEVTDTGVGMDEETRFRCLEPFYSTKGMRGTGLGLGMVYGVMRRHEGDIEVESQKGEGTTMRLLFPVSSPEEGADGSPALNETETAPVGPLRILCIDDEPLLRALVKEILEADGHVVDVADGGKPGLEAFRSGRARGVPYDVVLTDLGMPHVDGREVARTVKHESPDTPVIMLTGWGVYMQEDEALPPGVDVIVAKPPKISDLQRALRRVAAGPASPLISL